MTMQSTPRIRLRVKRPVTIGIAGLIAAATFVGSPTTSRLSPVGHHASVDTQPHQRHTVTNRSGSWWSNDDESDWWCGADGDWSSEGPDECSDDDSAYDDSSSYDDNGSDDTADEPAADDPAADDTPAAPVSVDQTLWATFPVVGNNLVIDGASPSAAKAAREIWNRFTTLIPLERRPMLKSFELRTHEGGNGAYVYLDTSIDGWVLGVQAGIDDPRERDEILVHEFGHLLTLNSGQLQRNVAELSCLTAYFGEGCAKADSLTARYMARFWPLAWRYQAETRPNTLYPQYPDSFVTSYAGFNPAEDMAETFTYFVVDPKPTRTRVADQKLNFFWSLPDMVRLRSQIRAALV